MPVAMNISKLNDLIDGKKYTKAALAAKCGFSRVTIDNLLSGADVKISTIEGVARAYGVSVGYFFDDEQSGPINTNTVKGNNNVLVGGHNSGTITQLENCAKEVEHLKEIIAEKERLISVLMDKSK